MQKIAQHLFLITILSFLMACGGGSDSSSYVNGKVTKTIVLSVLAVDGSAVSQNVNIDISGTEVLDGNQNPITSITYPATKTIKAEIDNDANVDLKLLAKTTNFVDSGLTIQLTPNSDDYTATIYLVPNTTGSSKAGIYTMVSPINNVTNGVVQNTITLALEESASTPNLTVTIPQGTKLSDASNSSVTPNSATLVRYDPLEEGVLDAYPGGLNVLADVDGAMEQVNFKSAGFASIVLKDTSGNKVKQFDQDITIAMQFKEGITDNNGKVAAVGDIVPVWSYDEDEGTWKYEQDGTVQDLNTNDGLFDVTYKTNHLTFYNLDWDIANVCNANIKVEDGNGAAQNNLLDVVFTMPAFNIDQNISYLGDGVITLNGLPTIATPWMMVFTDPDTDEEVGRYSSEESICNTNHTAVTNIDSADNIQVYGVTAIDTSGGADCDNYTGGITVTDGTAITGTVEGLEISGTRNADNGDVLFGLVGGTVAGFGGNINGNQGSGTWDQTGGSCSGTWAATLQ